MAVIRPTFAPSGSGLGWLPRYGLDVSFYSLNWLRRRFGTWLVTVAVIAMVLAVATIVQLVVWLTQRSVATQLQSASEMQVFLQDGATPAQEDALRARLATVPGVKAVTLRSKAEAEARALKDPQLQTLAAASEGNPFPASFVLVMSNPDVARPVLATAATDPAVDPKIPASYTAAQAHSVTRAITAIQVVAIAVDAMALGVGALVAMALLRGEVRARREELRILALVGVPRLVIRLPLLFQALSVALVGSAAAAVALTVFGQQVVPAINDSLPFLRLGDPSSTFRMLAAGTVAASCATMIPCALLVRLPR